MSLTSEELLKYLRANLPPMVEDRNFNQWILTNLCVYKNYGKCMGPIEADHVLGGYHGGKACGLLKVPACTKHNREAETKPEMHISVLHIAIKLRIEYDVNAKHYKRKRVTGSGKIF